MRTRLFLALVLAAVFFARNALAQENIAHGVRVVVLDAGHGGRFPGACYAGVKEKDLTLNIILRLGKLIEEGMPGVKVVYTRTTDKDLGTTITTDLQARADIANRAEGDIFISVHANAAPKAPSARGVETLIMGETSKEQSYNESALFDNNREDLIDMSDQRTAAIVRAYIQNLQFTYGQYSMAMARCIQESYRQSGRTVRGIKPQLLKVLYATDMPGILTEIGFLSNAQEVAYMKSEKGQAEIAQSLYKAVREYSASVLSARMGNEMPQEQNTQAAAPEEMQPEETNTAAMDTQKPKAAPVQPTEKAPAAPTTKTDAASPAKPAGKVRYAIQVMASTKPESLQSSNFKSYRGKVAQYAAEGTFRYKYCVEECAAEAEAKQRLSKVRKVFPGAFVVKCRDGKIVK